MIELSHIAIHTFTETNEICVDIFSCKPFNYENVKKLVVETFDLTPETTKVINYNHK